MWSLGSSPCPSVGYQRGDFPLQPPDGRPRGSSPFLMPTRLRCGRLWLWQVLCGDSLVTQLLLRPWCHWVAGHGRQLPHPCVENPSPACLEDWRGAIPSLPTEKYVVSLNWLSRESPVGHQHRDCGKRFSHKVTRQNFPKSWATEMLLQGQAAGT